MNTAPLHSYDCLSGAISYSLVVSAKFFCGGRYALCWSRSPERILNAVSGVSEAGAGGLRWAYEKIRDLAGLCPHTCSASQARSWSLIEKESAVWLFPSSA